MARAFTEIAFTPAVKSRQMERGSRSGYESFELPEVEAGDALGPSETAFIQARDGFYQATVSKKGWPYVQFRGGPAGFLRVFDNKTIGYADFRGNRQYISSGNLTENNRVSLILMDYPNRSRLKIWAHARQVEAKEDPELIKRLRPEGYRALLERAVLLTVEAFDWNCPSHIPQRLTMAEIAPHLQPLHDRISELQTENQKLAERLTGFG